MGRFRFGIWCYFGNRYQNASRDYTRSGTIEHLERVGQSALIGISEDRLCRLDARCAICLGKRYSQQKRHATLPAGLGTDHGRMTNLAKQEETALGSHLLGIEAAE
jgi:hypothetical protein